ncbi:alpha-E domain-containing protein [Heliobacterium undosum]|uniref:Alpha-E domain-containing protein n=1 Tax=Heliomicrobium undosum TaxID=121734 RepID=A0A845KXL0_9FIRM|nr:alpha-E domain-containing protein [Heliomicrobium undosum]MZP28342.1 alpha-E domain-containing protein [Heliomicrobium undosum]
MLSCRHADSLIWLSRFIERAENNARILEVNFVRPFSGENASWEPLVAVTGNVVDFQRLYDEADAASVFDFLAFSEANPNSIVACAALARENALAVRERLPNELYEVVNRFHLTLRACAHRVGESVVYPFLDLVKRQSMIFQGLIEAILPHGEDGAFLRIGRYLERIDKTSRILDVVHYHPDAADEELWLRVLCSVSAYEAYRRSGGGRVTPRDVTAFLVHDGDFPRSLAFCADQALLAAQRAFAGAGQIPESVRLLEQLDRRLRYTTMDEIEAQGLHAFLQVILQENNRIGEAVQRDLFVEEDSA